MEPAYMPLNEADLDRLEDILDSDIFGGEGPLLDELQAMLCAIVSGPEPVPPSVWLPAVLGESPAYESAAHADEVMGLVMRLYHDIDAAMGEGPGVSPILYPVAENSDELDFAAWAEAYLYGSEIGDVDWFDAAGQYADDLDELMQPLMLLSGVLKAEAEARREPWLSDAEEARLTAQARENLPEQVAAIHDFWKALAAPAVTYRRDTAKVGRNDPCPCGSGRKYKHCCGAIS